MKVRDRGEYQKKYREKNKEKISKQRKKSYKDNREKWSEADKKFYKDNREKYSEANKKAYKKRREGLLASKKEYYYANKKEILAYQKQKMFKIRVKTYFKLGGRCALCGKEHAVERTRTYNFHEIYGREHIGNPYKVYNNSDDFAILCCGSCHKYVHFAMKWLGMTWEEILERVVEVRGG